MLTSLPSPQGSSCHSDRTLATSHQAAALAASRNLFSAFQPFPLPAPFWPPTFSFSSRSTCRPKISELQTPLSPLSLFVISSLKNLAWLFWSYGLDGLNAVNASRWYRPRLWSLVWNQLDSFCLNRFDPYFLLFKSPKPQSCWNLSIPTCVLVQSARSTFCHYSNAHIS